MKKTFNILFILTLIILFPLSVKANSIDKIDMNIYVDNDGNAHVTETWTASLNSGTEGYKPYYNIGNANITNFKVSENGRNYTYQNSWNTNLSFNEKAYKNGINYVDNGIELCWGISNYGYHNYVLTYDINGFVSSLTDSDMIYWQLIPYDLLSKPSDVHIKLYSDKYFNNNLPVWGFGKYGATAYVYDGYIEMNSEGELNSNEYMVILAKFDKGTFNTNNILDKNFNYYLDMAQKGAKKYKDGSTDIDLFSVFFLLFCFTIIIILVKPKNYIDSGNKRLYFDKKRKKFSKDIPNIRDIPYNNDIFMAYWIADSYGLNKKRTDLLGAILLKWAKEKIITIEKMTKNGLKNKEQTVINLTKTPYLSNELEMSLYNMLKEASIDGILESKEFEKWCNKNYNKILKWYDKIYNYQTNILIEQGKIVKSKKRENAYNVLPAMKNEAVKLKGLKNFLTEFTRINKREAIEVNLWEYYLIYAQILGIADKVAKQFEKLYPEIIQNNSNYGYTYNDFIFLNTISNRGMVSAMSSKSRAQNYKAGGGGFSSGGGGFGSFGSGGGGGFR